jgi:lantibiotic modifying enzyme
MDAIEPDLNPIFPRLMPNFSHGTSGIAYFLATLYQETKQKEFLGASLNAAYYLVAIAKQDSHAAMIYHHEPDGKDLYYLGWCHGPAGTARLFYRLYQITGDPVWMELVRKFAGADLHSGIPEQQTPGFWNNVGQCCGSAGVAEFFLGLYRISSDKEYLDFSKRLTVNLLSRVTGDEKGDRWVQAEHRVKPDLLIAQTGYMQGAAGIGIWLLHLDAFEQGRKRTITLPDSPF